MKKLSKSKRLVVDGEPPSMIALLSLSALLVVVGVFVVQRGMASGRWGGEAAPLATPAYPTPTPTFTPTPSMSASPMPTQGPSRRP